MVEFTKLPLRTAQEMARGHFGKSPTEPEALEYMRCLQRTYDGQNELKALVRKDVRVLCTAVKGSMKTIQVSLYFGKEVGPQLVFSEDIETFPSEKLKAQIMLVAG
jgi:hypothetical protein